jgi:hypothetical protein
MARSWGSNSSSAQENWREEPPTPYRKGPLNYSPPRLCFCRRKAAQWISWSDNNLGRRYFTCLNQRVSFESESTGDSRIWADLVSTRGFAFHFDSWQTGGCSLWVWAEDPHPEYIQDLLRDL